MSGYSSRRPHAEFMQVWEEGYVGTTESFVTMHMQGVAIFSGDGLRKPDGALDRAAILAWIEAATRGIPYSRLRLQRAPLGLTPPAWVPVPVVEMDKHVRFGDDDVLAAGTLRRLIGWDEGALDVTAPLWRLRVTPLTDGRVALGILMHHAGGDALRTLKFLSSLTTSKPVTAPPTADPVFADSRAPRPGALPLLALQNWWGASDTPGARWSAYWRKPVARRARRVAARITRRLRDRPARPVTVHSGFRAYPGGAVQEAASAVDATMNDLVVAAAIDAASRGDGPVRVRVPVLRRATEASRNRVTDAAIVGERMPQVADLVSSVRDQLSRARDASATDDDALTASARDVGYATLVPWLSRARHLLGARLEEVIVLPASLPDDELSTFALLYDDKLSVVVTAPATTPLEPVLDDLGATLVGVGVR